MRLTTKITLTIILISNVAHADEKKISGFEKKLETYMESIKVIKGFSGEIMVARGNTALFQKTLGMASIEHQLKLKKGAKYRIASITKTFTAMLILLAQEDKKINIQDKVIKYIPQLSPKFKNMTIHQLLTHTSGLPHYDGIKDYWRIKSKLQITKQQALEEINKFELLFTPGSDMKYSSLGYYLLALVLEQVYEDNFESILKDKILSQLHMSATGQVNTLDIIPQMASGYHRVNDDTLKVAPYRNYSMLKGSGDMYSTTTDLLKWANGIYSHTLISEKLTTMLFTPQSKKQTKYGNYYGYGWYLNAEKPHKYYHGGGTWGYSTYLALYPDEKISIIILSNVSTLPMTAIGSEVEKIVFNQPFQVPDLPKEVSVEASEIEHYVGEYQSDTSAMVLRIFNKNSSLYAKLSNNPAFEIYAKGDHQFFGKKLNIDFIFTLEEGQVTRLKAIRMGQTFNFSALDK